METRPGLLERWGRFAVRRRWFVLAVWVVILAGGALAARQVSEGLSNRMDIPDSDSQIAVDVLKASFPERAGDYGDIVFRAPDGIDTPDVRRQIELLLTGAAGVPDVVQIASPFDPGGLISADGAAAIARIQFATDADNVPGESVRSIEALIVAARAPGVLDVEFGGPVAAAQEREGPSESTVIGIVAALIILLILFRTLVPAVLPLFTAVAGLAAGFAAIYAMTAAVDLSRFAPNISAMLGLGVGIDYALFITARHIEGARAGRGIAESAGAALATSGKSVAFAGGVVITSLLGLSFMGIPFVGWLGVAAAAMVLLAVLVALTLLPALLGIAGDTVLHLPGRPLKPAPPPEHESGIWYRLSHAIMRRPYVFLTISGAILATLSAPVVSMRLGSADAGNNPTSSTTRRAYDIVAEAFGPGMNGPLLVVVSGATATQIESARERIATSDGVASVGLPIVSPAGKVAIFSVIPTTSPQDARTTTLVHELRTTVLPGSLASTDAEVLVGGTTARFIDIADRISARLPLFFSLVIGFSFVLLMVQFRSIAIPIKAALMNLLSIGAAYGVVVAVFQWGWGLSLVGADHTGPIESFLPMMLFAVLFGLSMDYEVFLVSRIREEYLHTGDNAASVARGLEATASVITAAATIMIFVFLSFILNEQRVVKEFGLGLAAAIFVDATVVRLLLVPATMELLGKWNWWLPRWLDRVLPEVSVEG